MGCRTEADVVAWLITSGLVLPRQGPRHDEDHRRRSAPARSGSCRVRGTHPIFFTVARLRTLALLAFWGISSRVYPVADLAGSY